MKKRQNQVSTGFYGGMILQNTFRKNQVQAYYIKK